MFYSRSQRTGFKPVFYAKVKIMQADEIQAILQPALAQHGFELVGIEMASGPRRPLLRIFADIPGGGISALQLGAVGHHVLDSLRLAGMDTELFHFEVSSPGLNRRLFTLAQCLPYIGQVIAVKLRQTILGRQRYKGVLTAIQDENLLLTVQDTDTAEEVSITCPWDQVIKATVVADLRKYLTAEKKK